MQLVEVGEVTVGGAVDQCPRREQVLDGPGLECHRHQSHSAAGVRLDDHELSCPLQTRHVIFVEDDLFPENLDAVLEVLEFRRDLLVSQQACFQLSFGICPELIRRLRLLFGLFELAPRPIYVVLRLGGRADGDQRQESEAEEESRCTDRA